MGSFGDSLLKNTSKILANVDIAISLKIVDGFNKAVELSPVQPEAPYAAGHFVNNWRLGINSTSTENSSGTDMQGAASYASIAELLVAKAFLAKDGFVTLTNNTEYSAAIEYNGWPSGKAPYSPLRQAITYFISKK